MRYLYWYLGVMAILAVAGAWSMLTLRWKLGRVKFHVYLQELHGNATATVTCGIVSVLLWPVAYPLIGLALLAIWWWSRKEKSSEKH